MILNPRALYLLIPVAVIGLIVGATRYRALWRVYIRLGGSSSNRSLFTLKYALSSLSAFFFSVFVIMALADIYRGRSLSKTENGGLDIAIGLDVSGSMEAMDESPSRLSRAKELAQELAYSLPGARVGVAIFKGAGLAVIPLTEDYAMVSIFLQSATGASLTAPGSNLGSGIEAALRLLPEGDERKRVIVLFSDGESLGGDFNRAVTAAVRAGVTIDAVGVGRSEPAILKDEQGKPRVTAAGKIIRTSLEEAPLKTAAQLTRGLYVHANDGVGAIINALKDYRATGYRTDSNPRGLFNFFTCLAAMCATLWIIVRNLPWKRLYGAV